MEHAFPPSGLSATVLVNEFKQVVEALPARYSRKLRVVYERIEHWMHLRDQVGRVAETTITDLQLENSCLRFDLDMTRRELDETRKQGDGG